jgi:hypothetical protein
VLQYHDGSATALSGCIAEWLVLIVDPVIDASCHGVKAHEWAVVVGGQLKIPGGGGKVRVTDKWKGARQEHELLVPQSTNAYTDTILV